MPKMVRCDVPHAYGRNFDTIVESKERNVYHVTWLARHYRFSTGKECVLLGFGHEPFLSSLSDQMTSPPVLMIGERVSITGLSSSITGDQKLINIRSKLLLTLHIARLFNCS